MSSLYRVHVLINGRLVADYTVEAADALSAINLVEANYGPPPVVEYKTIFREDGSKEHVLVVSSWHGYSFIARRITET